MYKIKFNKSRISTRHLDTNLKHYIAVAPKFGVGIIGHSFVRRWARECIQHTSYRASSVLSTELGLVSEDVSEHKLSTTPILSHLKCDNKISKVYVFGGEGHNKLNLVSQLHSYVDMINSWTDVKMLIVDIFSNSIAALSETPSGAPGYDHAIDTALTLILSDFKSFISSIRSDIVVVALSVTPRTGGLLRPIKRSPYQKKKNHTSEDIAAAQQRFDQRRLAINITLHQMDQEARLGQSPTNFRYHPITCWPNNNIHDWMHKDNIHPTPEQLRIHYSSQLKKAIQNTKNKPVVHQILTDQNRHN